MSHGDGCTKLDIEKYEALNCRNKVIFTAREYPDFKSSYHIPQSETYADSVKNLCSYKNMFTGRRIIDDFDYVAFINGSKPIE